LSAGLEKTGSSVRPPAFFAVRRDAQRRTVVTGSDESKNGELAMQLNVPPDLETLIKKHLSSGVYASVEDVLRRALEAQDAVESRTAEERRTLCAHIEEGYQQAEHGELIDGGQARREIQAMKDDRRLSKR
jgi:Arc/MetJ-type ribon-helix-helix transcriptional regulator